MINYKGLRINFQTLLILIILKQLNFTLKNINNLNNLNNNKVIAPKFL